MPQKLDPIEALDIAIRCVHEVSGNDSEEGDKLENVGIVDEDDVRDLKDTIVNTPVGVQQDGYEMEIEDLNGMSTSWTVGGVGRRIRKKAVPA